MSGQTTVQEQRASERQQAHAIYTDSHPPGARVRYRGYTLQKELADYALDGTWRLRNELDEAVATVEVGEFDSPREWLQFVDAVIHSGPEQACQWFDVPYGRPPENGE